MKRARIGCLALAALVVIVGCLCFGRVARQLWTAGLTFLNTLGDEPYPEQAPGWTEALTQESAAPYVSPVAASSSSASYDTFDETFEATDEVYPVPVDQLPEELAKENE